MPEIANPAKHILDTIEQFNCESPEDVSIAIEDIINWTDGSILEEIRNLWVVSHTRWLDEIKNHLADLYRDTNEIFNSEI